MVKTVKVIVQYTFFIEIVGIFGFICNEGTGVRVYSGGRRMVPSPTPLFFFNKDGNENVARKFNLLSFWTRSICQM